MSYLRRKWLLEISLLLSASLLRKLTTLPFIRWKKRKQLFDMSRLGVRSNSKRHLRHSIGLRVFYKPSDV